MKTTIIFVRHCESDGSCKDEVNRLLTERGMESVNDVTEVLKNYKVDKIYSSPFKRTLDTIGGYAKYSGLPVETDVGFSERLVGKNIDDFNNFVKRQWSDFDYFQEGGNSLNVVQKNNVEALKRVLEKNQGKTVVVATHGCALTLILNYFDKSKGYDMHKYILPQLPFMMKLEIDGDKCVSMEEIAVPHVRRDYNETHK